MYETEVTNINPSEKPILQTNIPGFDSLFSDGGIPKGSTVMIAGGPGTGKSTLCRQICYHHVSMNKPCMYVSFEENKERIIKSMASFGWDVRSQIESDQFLIQKINPLDVLRMKFGSLGGSGSATELSTKIKPLVIPKDFNPEIIVVDSLSAIIAASITKEKNYVLARKKLLMSLVNYPFNFKAYKYLCLSFLEPRIVANLIKLKRAILPK